MHDEFTVLRVYMKPIYVLSLKDIFKYHKHARL